MKIRAFLAADEAAVIDIWTRCDLVRPWNDPAKDIRRKLAVRPDLFLVGVVEKQIVGTIMAGYDGHRGWLNYLALLPEFQRRGLARLLVAEAERLLRLEGWAKIKLAGRGSHQAGRAFD